MTTLTNNKTLKPIPVEHFKEEFLNIETNENSASRSLAKLTYDGRPLVIQTTYCRSPWVPTLHPNNPNLRISVSLGNDVPIEEDPLRLALEQIDEATIRWAANNPRLCKTFGKDIYTDSEDDRVSALRDRYCPLVKPGTKGYADMFRFKVYATKDAEGDYDCNVAEFLSGEFISTKLNVQNLESVLRRNSRLACIVEIPSVWCMVNQFGLVVKASSIRVRPPLQREPFSYDWVGV